jgi:transformation/transcription domain-associated protein
MHGFVIQNPVARHGRKEERLLQLLRLVRGSLARKVRTRRRNLQIAVPVVVSLSSHARMIQEDCELESLEELMNDAGLDSDAMVYDYVLQLKRELMQHTPQDSSGASKQVRARM